MTVIVKITSGENKADENVSKGFELIPIAAGMRASFIRDEDGKGWLNVRGEDSHGEERLMMNLPVLGNAYIMDDGKTVASFSSANIPDRSPYPRGQTPGFTTIDESPILPDIDDTDDIVGARLKVSGNESVNSPEVISTLDKNLREGLSLVNIDVVERTISKLLYNGDKAELIPEDEQTFITGLAAAIVTYCSFGTHRRLPINLEFLGNARFDVECIKKLCDEYRVVNNPINLHIDHDEQGCISGYSIDAYYQRYVVGEAEMLLLRELRNGQKGLVKNLIDKVIKYYKAGVPVVPLEPATEITFGARRRITAKLNEVLTYARFNLISADSDEKVYGVSDRCDEDGAAFYTHVVIKFLH